MLAEKNKNRSAARFEKIESDFDALLTVYKVGEGDWRGFAYPYGETTEGPSKKETTKKLRELTEAYYLIVKKYNSPKHLVNGHLELQDREVFGSVVTNKPFMEQVYSDTGKADSEDIYVEAYRGKS
jgi:hypothetical protein